MVLTFESQIGAMSIGNDQWAVRTVGLPGGIRTDRCEEMGHQ